MYPMSANTDDVVMAVARRVVVMSSSCSISSPAAESMTSKVISVSEIEMSPSVDETTALKACVRRSAAVAGVVAATSVVAQRSSASPDCLIVVNLLPADGCDDVDAEKTMQSLPDPEHTLSAVCSNNQPDDAEKGSSESPSRPCGRLGRMLGRLTVRSKRQSAERKRKPTQRCQSWSGCSRRVAIESSLSVTSNSSRRRHQATADSCDSVDNDNQERDERPIQQFAMSFTSTDVRDGRFTARLPVDVIPRGDVMIRMRSGRLEVLQAELSDEAGATRRLKGVIELPMYVDAESVTVRHDPLQQCLVIEATTKGFRRRSVSLDAMWWLRSRKAAHDLGVRLMPTWKRRDDDDAIVLCSETRAGDDTSHN